MQRNSNKCGHCGRFFVRTDLTAIVNRSDGRTFHVSLLSGPRPRPIISGGFYAHQAMCEFGYVHDLIGPKRNLLIVFISHAHEMRRELLQQIEMAADKIVGLVHAGPKLEPTYTLDRGLFVPGFPELIWQPSKL